MEKETLQKLKKRLIAGGLYIALAATVVGVTTRSINKILTGDGYDIENQNTQDKEYTSDIIIPDSISGILEDSEEVSDLPDNVDSKIEENSSSVSSPDESVQETENESSEETMEEILYDTLYIKPVSGYISKEFSDTYLVYSPSMYDYRTHSAIDIAADLSTPVKAFAGGIISDIYTDPLYGVTVVIEHANSIESRYSNLSETFPEGIEKGALVTVGDVIGAVGDSADCESAEAPHLHFEVIKDGKKCNPEDFYEQAE